MKKIVNKEIKSIYMLICTIFLIFLVIPCFVLFVKSITGNNGITLEYYKNIVSNHNFPVIVRNSFRISLVSALITTFAAFLLAYSIHFTNIPEWIKKGIKTFAVLPMLLPTITYGFAIMYSFGKQGLLTRIFGRQLFDLYGTNGLLLGYFIYTLPISFLLIHNTMGYIDKKFLIVSRVMGDSPIRTFLQTILRPLMGTMVASVIQCFFLSFTDFGIPASVGGKVEVIAGVLYNEMLGSVPNFHNGAVVAMIMLLPSIISIVLLSYLEKYNIRYSKVSNVELKHNKVRDFSFGVISIAVLTFVMSIFAVIILIPFIEEWPYRMSFTMVHIKAFFNDNALMQVFKNSVVTALLSALFGSLAVYGAALATARSTLNDRLKKVIEGIALVTNTIPGMVLGIAFLLTFTGTSLQNTLIILVFCNMIHFFSTPYLMMKSSLQKMNASWEVTAKLMGDSWLKTVVRIVTPNASATIWEVFGYFFVNSMVTVSALVFLTGARTMVITTKIKELQHFSKFNEIFVLSLFILLTNLAIKAVLKIFESQKLQTLIKKKISKKEN